jgi:threonylcarbamoyladenosine tRNA methylthiotransferase MtaB
MGRFAVYTVGCKVNQAESEELRAELVERGHSPVSDPSEADLCVVNTCLVTAESERKTRKLIRALKRKGAGRVLAAGCYPQVKREELMASTGVDYVLPNSRKDLWAEYVAALLPPGEEGEKDSRTTRTRGFIKVQDGCERRCSYCIVPAARGPERSLSPREAAAKAERWLCRGVKELVLCGVNLGRYEGGPGYDLGGLVRYLLRLGEGFRIRLSSIEPEDLQSRWFLEWMESGRVCPHVHLPLQSGSAETLRDMGRGYNPEEYLELVEELRAVWPSATLTTEVIVGYPGETDDAFADTWRVLERASPSRLHVFRFSPRPGTPAWEKRESVDTREAAERSLLLRNWARKERLRYAASRRGGDCAVLVEKVKRQGAGWTAEGTTEDYLKARIMNLDFPAKPGGLIKGRICAVDGDVAILDGGSVRAE